MYVCISVHMWGLIAASNVYMLTGHTVCMCTYVCMYLCTVVCFVLIMYTFVALQRMDMERMSRETIVSVFHYCKHSL